MNRFYITTPIYYVNDVPHIGHAYTTVAADVLARWHRLQGREVYFQTGTDEHGTKIAQAAAAHNKDPQVYCDEIAAKFQEAWKALGIRHDSFIRTTDPAHTRGVQAFLKLLWDRGVIYKGRYQGKYCVQCERFYAEDELAGGLCPDHRLRPEEQVEDNYFFRLSDFQQRLLDAITQDDHPDHFDIFPLERRKEVIGKLKQEVKDISISRATLAWGVPLPWDRSQTTYVWVDALLNYVTGVGFPDDPPRMDHWWPANIHLMAKDILWFHAVIWPALLMAAGFKTPRTVFSHGFFTVNGQKMSKSLGNVVRPADLIKRYGVDGTRYLLLSAFPFGADGDFTHDLMTTAYNANLANDLGNLVSRALTMVEKYTGGKVPAGVSRELLDSVLKILGPMGAALEGLAFHQALTILMNAVNHANRFIENKAPWRMAKESPDQLPDVLWNVLVSLKAIAFFLWPFLPESAQNLWEQLGHSGPLEAAGKEFFAHPAGVALPVGQSTQKGPVLFPRK